MTKKALGLAALGVFCWINLAWALDGQPRDTQAVQSYLHELKDTFTNSVGIELKYVPPGSCPIGNDAPGCAIDETPVHQVPFNSGFYLGTHEVTQAQWDAVMGSNNSYFPGENRPVEKVAWLEVQTFLKKLNEREKTDRYQLPTEEEWEYACRAGSTSPYYWGDAPDPECAWYRDNSDEQTHDVGMKKPNAWGFFDMSGNVSEWCANVYAPYPGSAMEPPATDDQPTPVTRGGSWISQADDVRSANRSRLWQHYRLSMTGFRLKALP